MGLLICSRCNREYERPPKLATSTFAQCPFVCENCRCKDCSIVLGFECECGDRHADRSSEDPQVCVECQKIRQRISKLEPRFQFTHRRQKSRQEPVYGVVIPQVSEMPVNKTGDN